MKKSRKKSSAASPAAQPESLAALADGMADDFNNILTTVMGACTLIDKDNPANSELRHCVALIRASAEHAADLSDRLARVGRDEKKCANCVICSQDSISNGTSLRDKKTNDAIVTPAIKPDGAAS